MRGEQAASEALVTVAASTHKRYGQLLRLHAYPYIGKLRLSKLEPARLAGSTRVGSRRGSPHHRPPAPPGPPPRAQGRPSAGPRPPQRRRTGDPARQDRARVPHAVTQAGATLPRGRHWEPARSAGRGGAHDRHAGRRAARAPLGRHRPRRRRLPRGQEAQAANLTPTGPPRRRRGPGAQPPPGTPGGGTPPGRLDLGRQRGWCSPNTIGRPINPSNFLRREFYPLLKKASLPRMRFHDFRHSAATLLLGMGVHPKIVSELLGHTQIGITLDLYSHVTATMQRDAVQAFEELLGSSQGSSRGSEDDEERHRRS